MKLDKRSLRRILLGVPLAAFVLTLFVSWGLVARERAHADFPHTGINFSLTGPGGCSSSGTGICYLSADETFQINWVVTSLPGGFTYTGYDTNMSYSGVTVSQGSLTQTGAGAWPGCYSAASKFTAGTVQTLCAIINGGSASAYTGAMWFISVKCPATPGVGQISLHHGQGNTDLVDASLVAHGEAASGSENLTIDCSAPTPTPEPPQDFAGTDIPGYSGDEGPAADAQLNGPGGIAGDGGDVYIADSTNCIVRKVSNGIITTVAGVVPNPSLHCGYTGDNGPATLAELNDPRDVFVIGTDLYIADTGNCRIRRVDLNPPYHITTDSGGDCSSNPYTLSVAVVTTTSAASAYQRAPLGGSAASITTTIYQSTSTCPSGSCSSADMCQVTRQVNTGLPVPVVGTNCGFGGDNGPGMQAKLKNPTQIAILDPSSIVLIADTGNNRIRAYDPAIDVITTIAGGGSGCSIDGSPVPAPYDGCLPTEANLNAPAGVMALNYQIYIADTGNNRIRRVAALYHTIATAVDENASSNPISPTSVTVDADGTFHYCDSVGQCKSTRRPQSANSNGGQNGNFVPTSGCGLVPGVGTIDFALPALLLGLIATRKRLRGLWRWFSVLLAPDSRRAAERSGG